MTEKKKRKLRETAFIIGMLGWPLLMFCIFYVGVNGSSVLLAFQRIDKNFNYHWNGLNNFKDAFLKLADGSSVLKVALFNNIQIFFWTLIIGFPLNMIFGYYLFKKKVRASSRSLCYNDAFVAVRYGCQLALPALL